MIKSTINCKILKIKHDFGGFYSNFEQTFAICLTINL